MGMLTGARWPFVGAVALVVIAGGCSDTHGRSEGEGIDAGLGVALDAGRPLEGPLDAGADAGRDAFDPTLDAGPYSDLCSDISRGSVECFDRALRVLAEAECSAACGTGIPPRRCVEQRTAAEHGRDPDVELALGLVEVDLAAVACQAEALARCATTSPCDPVVRPSDPGASDERCFDDTCGAGLHCVAPDGCTSYCAPDRDTNVYDVAAGGACGSVNEGGVSTYRFCGGHLQCQDGVCVSLAQLGEPCGDLVCDVWLWCDHGTCAQADEPAPGIGDEGYGCDERVVFECLPPLFCQRGRCARSTRGIGAPCSADTPCFEGVCVPDGDGLRSHCADVRLAPGSPCTSHVECDHGTCCDNVCVAW